MIVTRRTTAGLAGFNIYDEHCSFWDEIHGDEDRKDYGPISYRAAYGLPIPVELLARIERSACCTELCIDRMVAEYGLPKPGDTAAGKNIEEGGTAPDVGEGTDQNALLLAMMAAQQQKSAEPLPSWVWPAVAGVGGLVALGVLASALRRRP